MASGLGGQVVLENAYDHHFKLWLLGDSWVGKTCVLHRYAHNEFDPIATRGQSAPT